MSSSSFSPQQQHQDHLLLFKNKMVLIEEESGLKSIRVGRTLFVRRVSISNSNLHNNNNNNHHHHPQQQQQHSTNDAAVVVVVQLVFLHGTCATEKQYQLLLQAIDTKLNNTNEISLQQEVQKQKKKNLILQCILYDAMGCGQSPILPNWDAYENQQAVEDLQCILEQNLIKSTIPTILIGHSYAPTIILNHLQQYSISNLIGIVFLSTAVRTSSLSLHPSGAGGEGQQQQQQQQQMAKQNIVPPDGGHPIMKLPIVVLKCVQKILTESFITMSVHESHTWLKDAIRQDSNQNNMAMAKAYHCHQQWANDTDLDIIVRNKIPTLIIHGVDDQIIPVSCGQYLYNTLSSASSSQLSSKLVIIDRASHMVMLEQPDQVADAIITFIMNSSKLVVI